jgi:hypothetical protein
LCGYNEKKWEKLAYRYGIRLKILKAFFIYRIEVNVVVRQVVSVIKGVSGSIGCVISGYR